MEAINDLAVESLMGNALADWLAALSTLVLVAAGLRLVQVALLRRLKPLTEWKKFLWVSHVLTALAETRFIVLLILALGAASLALTLPSRAEQIITKLVVIAVLVQLGIWFSAFHNAWHEAYRKKNLATNPDAVTTVGATRILIKIAIWTSIVLLIFDNIGINVSTLIAGLGIGGVAVALATQNILGDIFASLSIVLDKPFIVGDFLIVGDFMGSVEHIGLKTTRIRSLSGEQIVFSNSDLLGSRIRNHGRMYERRVAVTLHVVYETDIEDIEKIPGIIKEAIEAQPKTRFDRAHFKGHGAYSLDFEYVYLMLSADYALYMDTQQRINLVIQRMFSEHGIRFAYQPAVSMLLPNAAAKTGQPAKTT